MDARPASGFQKNIADTKKKLSLMLVTLEDTIG
jgi:hypothetical protein